MKNKDGEKSYIKNTIYCLIFSLLVVVIIHSYNNKNIDIEQEKKNIDNVLNSMYEAGSKAQEEGFFEAFSDQAIIYGSDPTERWSFDTFRRIMFVRFSLGKSREYKTIERFIYVNDDANTAWYDERLTNKYFGDCRTTGVLQKIDGEWKIVQYNFSFPIPNALNSQILGIIKSHTSN